jgi:hypothetical protein
MVEYDLVVSRTPAGTPQHLLHLPLKPHNPWALSHTGRSQETISGASADPFFSLLTFCMCDSGEATDALAWLAHELPNVKGRTGKDGAMPCEAFTGF